MEKGTNWSPEQVTHLFEQLESTGIASLLRALAFVADAGVEHLQMRNADGGTRRVELQEPLPADIEPAIEPEPDPPVGMIKFGPAARQIGVTTKTLHNWSKQHLIKGVRQLGPKTFAMPITEAERISKENNLQPCR